MALESFNAVGRRKTAIARVYLRPGRGSWKVNGRTLEDYFSREICRQVCEEPLNVADAVGKFDIKVNVGGGGASGQAGAIRLGVARALLKYDEELRPVLRKKELLTRDSRMVERKKYGLKKARKRFQFSKR